jgi:hypothetical protein
MKYKTANQTSPAGASRRELVDLCQLVNARVFQISDTFLELGGPVGVLQPVPFFKVLEVVKEAGA